MEGQIEEIIARKITDGLTFSVPALTRRDVRLPAVPGKALAVIGMRRAGKTSFLWQCLADRVAAGIPREALLYFNFEDERLDGLDASRLHLVVEEYFRRHPEWRDQQGGGGGGHGVTFFFDEIQLVSGWEVFLRRLMDTERVQIFISGSSARLLSREVATSMRGRALEVLVHPFSFREALRHNGSEPARGKSWNALPKGIRSGIEKQLRAYLAEGGFPEAQSRDARDRRDVLRSYADVALLRDVIERHGVSNPAALRWMLRHFLANPAAPFSVNKFSDALRSQGIPVAKDTVHAYLGYVEDAFIIRTLTLHTASERQRMANPRKAYPVDPGFIPFYERTGRENLGHALETAVFVELERRGAEIGYLKTSGGNEVDFHARLPDGEVWLIQVCTDTGSPETLGREARALEEAAAEYPRATPLLVSMDTQRPPGLPTGIGWQTAAAWLLEC